MNDNWKRQWSYIVDPRGIDRIAIFYKAAQERESALKAFREGVDRMEEAAKTLEGKAYLCDTTP